MKKKYISIINHRYTALVNENLLTLDEALAKIKAVYDEKDDHMIIEIDVENEKVKTHSIELKGGEIKLKE